MVGALRTGDPRTVGQYRLTGRLGAGGMGEVFLAESPAGRQVAVKLIRAEYARDAGFRERFSREVAAARLVGGFHTAQVVDADPEAEQPWLAAAYIPGPTLRARVTGTGPLPPDALVRLAAGLAEGLAAIHACGLIHRDLKPGNVILAPDGPRIIDFGVAYGTGTGAEAATGTGALLGTYAYMSPEQLRAGRVTAACDVWALGAVLAFAASGQGPFDATSVPAIVHRVTSEPPRLDALPPGLRDLTAACLAKDPPARPTAAQILHGRTAAPPLPRPPGPFPAPPAGPPAGGAGPFGGSPVGPSAGSPAGPSEGTPTGPSAGTPAGPSAGSPAGPSAGSPAGPSAGSPAGPSAGSPAGPSAGSPAGPSAGSPAGPFAGSPAGSFGGSPGGPRIGRRVLLAGGAGAAVAVAAGTAATVLLWPEGAAPRARASAPPKATVNPAAPVAALHGHTGQINRIAFGPDGRTLASASFDGTVRLWDVSARRALFTYGGDSGNRDVLALAYTPDGRTLFSGGFDNAIRRWDVHSGEPLGVLSSYTGSLSYVTCLAFSPDGSLVAAGVGAHVEVVRVSDGRTVARFTGHTGDIDDVAFSPDGSAVASVGADTGSESRVQLWSPRTGRLIRSFTAGDRKNYHVVMFSADGRTLAGSGPGVRLWETATGRLVQRLRDAHDYLGAAAYRPDGRAVAGAGGNNLSDLNGSLGKTVTVWDPVTARVLWTLTAVTPASDLITSAGSLAYSPDGRTLAGAFSLAAATGPGDVSIQLWELP